ncbi:YdcH family protein [Consotaella salsifontis]|uniref:DUF465 domain-containing protein n=1 Tax=Consotaella salsifontis TaxID=1365950 RepID=A0A1T4T3A9_9HYPH|nr:YdcH family protein [Consotaella salsifontis]SKA34985.1 hypothetical protein SAMN05428963_11834 [Consotaella salsifontis]
MSDQEQAGLRLQLARLRQEHADYDAAIGAMISVNCDPLQVQRMKKKKLAIRDKLKEIEDQIIPDIPA